MKTVFGFVVGATLGAANIAGAWALALAAEAAMKAYGFDAVAATLLVLCAGSLGAWAANQ